VELLPTQFFKIVFRFLFDRAGYYFYNLNSMVAQYFQRFLRGLAKSLFTRFYEFTSDFIH